MQPSFDSTNQLILPRAALQDAAIDIGGRDIIIGFNEPTLRASLEGGQRDLDAKLNARFITYFLPAVEIARMQPRRPRLIVVSGLNVALKWNAHSEREKTMMTINNNLKFDFLKIFFEKFYPDTFSIVEYIVSQDPLKIDEAQLLQLWNLIAAKHPKELDEIKLDLARFKRPTLFFDQHLSEEARAYLDSNNPELLNSFKYAMAHLLAFGDLNFEGNVIHNPIGYLSIGGVQEQTFNTIRSLAYDVLTDLKQDFFDQPVIAKQNLKLILQNQFKTPPPYNGYYTKHNGRLTLDEVTYENNRTVDFYDRHKKLQSELQYMYEHFISKTDYQQFWNNYKPRYVELKNRYQEAYRVRV